MGATKASGPKRDNARGARRGDQLGRRTGADAKSRPHRIQELGVGDIHVAPDRMRMLRPEVVDALAESISTQELQQSIIVRPRDGGGYWLVAGQHRFEACPQLKRPTIRADVRDLDDMAALLVEIDENLIRADLSPAERALHIGRRKELYEQLHPETVSVRVRGGPGRGKKNHRQNGDRFTKDAAKKTGRSERSVQREAERADRIPGLADVVGTSLDTPDELDALAKLPEAEQARFIKRAKAGERITVKTAAKQARRQQREAELGARIVALPTKQYGVVVEDFEWDQITWSEAGKDRHASNHYPTSTDAHTPEEIVERTRDRFKCAAADCVLAMWTTSPHLAIATKVMELRGFEYKTNVIWHKTRPGEGGGTGYWFINQHEQMLIGVRGNVPAPAPDTQWPSVIEAPVGKHSAKPEIFLQMLEEYFPNLPKIELNRRGPPRDGWDAWGNEVEHDEAPPPRATNDEQPAPDDDGLSGSPSSCAERQRDERASNHGRNHP